MRVERVESLDDPRVADYRNVRDADLRQDRLFLAEGRLNVKRLITVSPYRTRSVFVTDAGLRGLRESLERLGEDAPVFLAPQRVMNAVVGYDMHRGCLAAGERAPSPEPHALLARDGSGLVVVLEGVTNPDNVGGVFRNALAFGAGAVLLTRRCADPLYRKAIRVSMGASLRVPFAWAADGPTALTALGRAGFASVALDADRAAPLLDECPGAARLAVWLGGEGDGLSAAVVAGAQRRATIPMTGGADSLNAAVASGIALHHFRRRAAGAPSAPADPEGRP